MRIRLDPVVYDTRKKGNMALLQGALGRLAQCGRAQRWSPVGGGRSEAGPRIARGVAPQASARPGGVFAPATQKAVFWAGISQEARVPPDGYSTRWPLPDRSHRQFQPAGIRTGTGNHGDRPGHSPMCKPKFPASLCSLSWVSGISGGFHRTRTLGESEWIGAAC